MYIIIFVVWWLLPKTPGYISSFLGSLKEVYMKNKSRGVQLITVFTVLVMLICIIILVCQFAELHTLQKRLDTLESQKDYLNESLYNYDSMNDYYSKNRTEYLEDYARKTLNWAQTDETWYTH